VCKYHCFFQKERLKCQMDYMESVKQLEEKLVFNQQKHDRDGFTDDKCILQVLPFRNYFCCYIVVFLKESCVNCWY
jgi:hypothetical protein